MPTNSQSAIKSTFSRSVFYRRFFVTPGYNRPVSSFPYFGTDGHEIVLFIPESSAVSAGGRRKSVCADFCRKRKADNRRASHVSYPDTFHICAFGVIAWLSGAWQRHTHTPARRDYCVICKRLRTFKTCQILCGWKPSRVGLGPIRPPRRSPAAPAARRSAAPSISISSVTFLEVHAHDNSNC